jgi:hypothetical protein
MVKVWRYQRDNQDPSVILRSTDSDYPFGIFKLWPLCCLFFFNIRILITPLVSSSFDHCVVCSSSIYGFWLPLWYLQTLAIVLSVLLRYRDSDYLFGIFKLWPLCYLFFFKIRILIIPLVSSNFGHCVVCSSSKEEQPTQLPKFEDTKGIIRIRISRKNKQHNGQSLQIPKRLSESVYRRRTDNIDVCRFVLFLLAIVLSVLLQYTDSDYPFGIFKLWPLCCLFFTMVKVCRYQRGYQNPYIEEEQTTQWSKFEDTKEVIFFNIQILIIPLVSSNFDHCVVCSSSIHEFWLPLWYLQTLLGMAPALHNRKCGRCYILAALINC